MRSDALVDRVSCWLAARTSRRGFLGRAAVVGSALALDPVGYVLRPGTAYASVCGPGSSCASGWTVFCASINHGVNACPPGTIAAGWWKADGAPLCGGRARYIVDCNATSSCGCGGRGVAPSSCWSCRCSCGQEGCDNRRVCCNGFRYGQCHQEVGCVGGVACRVVSCTPPWQWEKCTTASATDNATRHHNSHALPQAWTAITARHVALGEHRSVLRAGIGAEQVVPGGRLQEYQGGLIVQPDGGRPWVVTAPELAAYTREGGVRGPLGLPVADAAPTGDGTGRYQSFAGGIVLWSRATGAVAVPADVRSAYRRLGGERGALGYPVQHARATGTPGGRYQGFQQGVVVVPPSAAAVGLAGDWHRAYRRLGHEAGPLSWPVAEQVAAPGGQWLECRSGALTARDGEPVVGVWGAIARAWRDSGPVPGPLGWPLADQYAVEGGERADFERGYAEERGGQVVVVPTG